MRPSLRLQGILALLVTAFSWGLNWPVLKLVLLEWPPLTFRVFTGAGGVALLICVALLRGERLWPPQGQWLRLVVSAVLNISSWMGLASLSLLWLDASEAAIIAYTMPVWAAMLAWPVLGERPTRLRVAGLVLGLSGMSVLMAGQLLGAPASVLVA